APIRAAVLAHLVPDDVALVLEAPRRHRLDAPGQQRIWDPQIKMRWFCHQFTDGQGADLLNRHRLVTREAPMLRRHFPGAIGEPRPAAELIEDGLQLAAAGDDDADIDGAQLEQEPEIVEVAVIEGILVVPLDLERNAIFETIHTMRRRLELVLVDDDARIELP